MFQFTFWGGISFGGPIVGRVSNAKLAVDGPTLRISGDGPGPVELFWQPRRTVALRHEQEELFVIPDAGTRAELPADTLFWLLPLDPDDPAPAVLFRSEDRSPIHIENQYHGVRVTAHGRSLTARCFANRPRCDVFGNGFSFDVPNGGLLARAHAGFYWDTLLPSVVERTRAALWPQRDGFVLSTLDMSSHAGTYPDVDHEFQIKGRLAWGNALDANVVRRMIDLQLLLMRQDPAGLWQNPCALQPSGVREYEVMRASRDKSANAAMFLLTGNIEVLESAWLYVALTKNKRWLGGAIGDLEGAASLILRHVDDAGRLRSDVYYEDAVIKEGREAQAAWFAAKGLRGLGELEKLLGRDEQAARYQAVAARIAGAAAGVVPDGFWDPAAGRFVDWVDVRGKVHDHFHLLANALPVLFGYASGRQASLVRGAIAGRDEEFQRFPSFVAADIADYDADGELPDAGPYDLCAAGRYWAWDAGYRWHLGEGQTLARQLEAVARQAQREGYRMGERYDMDHVYYVDGSPWHGASHYYEYPCTFSWVLVREYLGVRPTLDADLEIAPCLESFGSVRLELPHFAVAYRYAADGFTLTNLGDRARRFRVDLSKLAGAGAWRAADGKAALPAVITLAAGESADFVRG